MALVVAEEAPEAAADEPSVSDVCDRCERLRESCPSRNGEIYCGFHNWHRNFFGWQAQLRAIHIRDGKPGYTNPISGYRDPAGDYCLKCETCAQASPYGTRAANRWARGFKAPDRSVQITH